MCGRRDNEQRTLLYCESKKDPKISQAGALYVLNCNEEVRVNWQYKVLEGVFPRLLEERSHGKSTVFTMRLPLDHWTEVSADPVIADAIRVRLDRGESYRGVKGRELASKR